MADVDIKLGRVAVREAWVDYFPTIKGQVIGEYEKDLTGNLASVVAVGNAFVPAGTHFQNYIALNLNQNLYDFGVRERKLEIAKKGVKIQESTYKQTERDLKLKLVDLYSDLLLTERSLKSKEAILPLYQQIFQMKDRISERELRPRWTSRKKQSKWRKHWMRFKVCKRNSKPTLSI